MPSILRLTTRFASVNARSTVIRPARTFTTAPFRFAQTPQSPDPKNPKQSPPSDSASEGGIKSSRALDDPSTTEQGGSATAKPLSGDNVSDAGGQSEAGGDPAKQDPSKSDAEKRKGVEAQQKPLDAADK